MKRLKVVRDTKGVLRYSHIYIAALLTQPDGKQFILVDDNYDKLSSNAQKFIVAHEEGHRQALNNEFVADSNALKVLGRKNTAAAMTEITKLLLRIDWTAACEFIYRMDLLGFKRAKWFAVVAPNGKVFTLKKLRPFYENDSYRFGKEVR